MAEKYIEQTILQQQIQQLTTEIENKDKKIEKLEQKVSEFQEIQGKIM